MSIARPAALQPLDLNGPIDRPFRPFPEAWLERPAFAIFAEAAAARPDDRAIVDDERYLTYREVHDQALRLAGRIAALVEPGRPIGIALPNGATYPVAMLAALAAGRPYLPLDTSFPERRNAHIAQHAGIGTVIVDPTTADAVRRIDPTLRQLDFAADAAVDGPAPVAASPDGVAYVLYTSGSTGQPKGVQVGQRALLHDAMRRTNCVHISRDDRIVLVLASTVAAAQQNIYGALLNGATLVVDLRRKGFQELVRLIRRERVTLYFSVGAVFRHLLEICPDPGAFATIRHVCIGGDRIFASDVELFRRRFAPGVHLSVGLGSSEAQMFAHWFIERGRAMAEPLVPVGYVLPGCGVTLVDPMGAPVPPGEVGEIVVTGRHVALGYWHDPALSRQMSS